MDKKVTGIVGYIGFIGWIIAYLAGDKEGAKFHLNQALVLYIAIIVLNIAAISSVLIWIPIIVVVLNVAMLVFWILGIVAAIKEEEKEIPIIGQIKILK